MNTSVIKFTALCAAAILSFTTASAQKHIKGSGNIITRTMRIGSYDKIEANRSVRVVVEDRTDDKVVIKADDNVMPYVKVYIDDKTLNVTVDNKVRELTNITVDVTVPYDKRLRSLEVTGAAQIDAKATIECDELEIEATAAGKITFTKADVRRCGIETTSASYVAGAVKADLCSVDTSSASKTELALLAVTCAVDSSSASNVILSGEAGAVSLDASSAAKIDAEALVSRKASADVSSGARIKVNCTESLAADASSGGSIHYKGGARLSLMEASSGGSVKEL